MSNSPSNEPLSLWMQAKYESGTELRFSQGITTMLERRNVFIVSAETCFCEDSTDRAQSDCEKLHHGKLIFFFKSFYLDCGHYQMDFGKHVVQPANLRPLLVFLILL